MTLSQRYCKTSLEFDCVIESISWIYQQPPTHYPLKPLRSQLEDIHRHEAIHFLIDMWQTDLRQATAEQEKQKNNKKSTQSEIDRCTLLAFWTKSHISVLSTRSQNVLASLFSSPIPSFWVPQTSFESLLSTVFAGTWILHGSWSDRTQTAWCP